MESRDAASDSLAQDGSEVIWSAKKDFNLTENIQAEKYMSVQDITEILQNLARTSPSLAQFEELSQASDNISIPVLHIFKDVNAAGNSGTERQDNKPHVLLVGNLNGDSLVGQEMLVRLARHLNTGFVHGDTTVTDILSTVHVHIVPGFNVHGAQFAVPGDCTGEKYTVSRFNQLVQDQDVTVSFLNNLIGRHKFDLIVDVEGGGKFIDIPRHVAVNTAANTGSELTDHEDILQEVAKSFASEMVDIYNKDACAGTANFSGIIHGVQMGSEALALADSWYNNYRTLTMRTYVACCKYPPAADLQHIWMSSLQPLLNVLSKSRQGIQGQVTNEKGELIQSYSLQLDNKPRQEMTSPFFMLTTAGQHTMTVEASGYRKWSGPALVAADSLSDQTIVLQWDTTSSQTMEYHDYQQMTDLLTNVSSLCPDIMHMTSLGKTTLESDVWMIHFGQNVTERVPPRIMFVGQIHGEEMTSREILLQLIVHLCDSYGHDPYVKKMLNKLHIFIIPSVNVDGARLASLGVCEAGSGHTNTHNVDLDTNFYSKDDYEKVGEQTETKAVKQALEESSSPIVVSVRSGDNVVSYVGSVDRELANAYINGRAPEKSRSHECPGQKVSYPSPVVEYEKHFSQPGSLMSYVHNVEHRAALELRLGCCRYPQPQQLDSVWTENVQAFMSLISESRKGVFGVVVDSDSKKLLAKVRVEVMAPGYVQYTDDRGRFAFYLPNGTYTFKSVATGYRDKETRVNVLLGPNASEVMLEMVANTWLLGMSPALTVTIIGCSILLLVIFITAVMCLKKSGRMHYDEMGFLELPSADYDDDDSDSFEDVVMDRNSFPMKQRRDNHPSAEADEYHDDFSSDEDRESSLFEKPLVRNRN